MGDPDEPTLRPDLLDGRESVKPAPDRSIEEHRDQIPLGRLDLLADQDGQWQTFARRDLASLQCAIQAVVVGDGEVSQAATRRGADDGPWRRKRIE
jgi:hypothetical protein